MADYRINDTEIRRRMKMTDLKVNDTIDITDVLCPVTFVKAKVALEELDEGQVISIRMNDGEPVQNVPRSIKEEGHAVTRLQQKGFLLLAM